MIKVAAGRMESKVEDCAIQVYRGAGVSDDFPLTEMLENYYYYIFPDSFSKLYSVC